MAVYGIHNIVSEETNQNIAITEAYLNVINEDYNLIPKKYLLTEAIDFKKIKDTVVSKATEIFKAIRKVFELTLAQVGKLIDKIKKVFNRFLDNQAVKKLAKVKEVKISKDLGIKKPVIDPSKKVLDTMDSYYHKIDDIFEKSCDSTKKEIESLINNSANPMTHHQEMQDAVNQQEDATKQNSEKIYKEMKALDLKKLFFDTDDAADFSLSGDDIINLNHTATTNSLLPKIQKAIEKSKSNLDTMEKLYEQSLNATISMMSRSKDLENLQQSGIKLLTSCFSSCNSTILSAFSVATTEMMSKLTQYSTQWCNAVIKIYEEAIRQNRWLAPKQQKEDQFKDMWHSERLDKMIDDGDVKGLRDALPSFVYRDLLFKDGILEQYIKYAKYMGLDPMEDFAEGGHKLIYGTKPNDQLTDDDFAQAVLNLRRNFSKERIKDLYQISIIVNAEEDSSDSKKNSSISNSKDNKSNQSYNEIEQAIQNKDIRRLRRALASLVYVDLDFSKGTMEDQIKYAEGKGFKVKEKLDKSEPIISKTKNTFTEDDFADAVRNLKENFCDERIEDLKIISKQVNK